MPFQWAFGVVVSIAIVTLYACLVRVFYEVRVLRLRLDRTRLVDPRQDLLPELPLGWMSSHEVEPAWTIAMTGDSTCPTCWEVLEELARLPLRAHPLLFTSSSPSAWGPESGRFKILNDPEIWSRVAHINPPTLLLLSPAGEVAGIMLPSNPNEIRSQLHAWGVLQVEKASHEPI
jgi:hypothetical protein